MTARAETFGGLDGTRVINASRIVKFCGAMRTGGCWRLEIESASEQLWSDPPSGLEGGRVSGSQGDDEERALASPSASGPVERAAAAGGPCRQQVMRDGGDCPAGWHSSACAGQPHGDMPFPSILTGRPPPPPSTRHREESRARLGLPGWARRFQRCRSCMAAQDPAWLFCLRPAPPAGGAPLGVRDAQNDHLRTPGL